VNSGVVGSRPLLYLVSACRVTDFSESLPSLAAVVILFNSKKFVMKKIGRNEPCHCGSKKKYKKCCDGFGAVANPKTISVNFLQIS
jgi:hypothetical protein